MKRFLFLSFLIAIIVFEVFIFQKNDRLTIFSRKNNTSASQSDYEYENDLSSKLSPDGKILATAQGDTLILKDMMTTTQKEIPIEELSMGNEQNGFFLEGWSDDSNALWGIILFSESPNFFRVTAPSWHVDRYALPHLPLGRDYALNPNSGLLAFSTYPVFFEMEEFEEFEKSQQRVTLSVSDLFSGKLQLVAEATAKSFQPKWIGSNVLEYTDPATELRVRFTFQ